MSWLLDTNVLVNAKRDYCGFEFCPAFWDWLEVALEAGVVASVEAVFDELIDYGDQLSDWAREHRSFFRSPGVADVSALASVIQWADRSPDFRPSRKRNSLVRLTPHCLLQLLQVATSWSHTKFRETR